MKGRVSSLLGSGLVSALLVGSALGDSVSLTPQQLDSFVAMDLYPVSSFSLAPHADGQPYAVVYSELLGGGVEDKGEGRMKLPLSPPLDWSAFDSFRILIRNLNTASWVFAVGLMDADGTLITSSYQTLQPSAEFTLFSINLNAPEFDKSQVAKVYFGYLPDPVDGNGYAHFALAAPPDLVPEPASLAFLGLSLLGGAAFRRYWRG